MQYKEPVFSPDAHRQLRELRVYDQRKIIAAIRKHLVEADPCQQTRNKFALRHTSQYADYELRVENLRVFYRITEEGDVCITLIGVKRGNKLLIDGEEFEL